MAFRAAQAFTTWIGGEKRNYAKDAVVPDEIATKALALVYGEPDEQPRGRKATAKAAASDD